VTHRSLPHAGPTCSSFRTQDGIEAAYRDCESFVRIDVLINSMLPTESSGPNLCYLPVLHRGIPIATFGPYGWALARRRACLSSTYFRCVGRCPYTGSRGRRLLPHADAAHGPRIRIDARLAASDLELKNNSVPFRALRPGASNIAWGGILSKVVIVFYPMFVAAFPSLTYGTVLQWSLIVRQRSSAPDGDPTQNDLESRPMAAYNGGVTARGGPG